MLEEYYFGGTSQKSTLYKMFIWHQVGVNVKDGGKYAFLGMESREAGDAVINALNQQVHM